MFTHLTLQRLFCACPVFEWTKFRKHKGGIKLHTLYDIEVEVPAFLHYYTCQYSRFKGDA